MKVEKRCDDIVSENFPDFATEISNWMILTKPSNVAKSHEIFIQVSKFDNISVVNW